MKKDNDNFALLPEEEKALIIQKRSRKRLFFAFAIIDILLLIYLVYSLISLFMHL